MSDRVGALHIFLTARRVPFERSAKTRIARLECLSI